MAWFPRGEQTEQVEITISIRTLVRLLVFIVVTILLLAALRKTTHAMTLIFISLFMALALNGPVHWVARHMPGKLRGSRSVATSISFLIVVVLLGAFLASLVPPLVRQTESLVSAAPNLIRDLHDQNSEVGRLIRHYHLDGQINTFSTQLADRLKNAGGTAFATISRVGTSIFSGLTILALTFMMLVEGPHWLQFGLRLVPRRHRSDAEGLAADMYRVIKGYVNGQVTLAAIASLFIAPALFMLHVSYPAALIVVVFVCGLIPMVGHTIGAILVTGVALFHSLPAAVIILAYYILYQQIENYLIQPRVQANSTNLSPLLVFASVVIGVSFNGLLGGLVAIPLMGCLRIIVLYYLEARDLLSKKEVEQQLEAKSS